MAYRRTNRQQNAKIMLIIVGISLFVLLLTVGIVKSNTLTIVTAFITLVVAFIAASTDSRRARSRPRGSKRDMLGRRKRGEWHPTYSTRQYMLKRDRREARLRRQGRDIEADKDEKETNRQTWSKDSRNI
jgi:hypothetical protein